MNLDEEQVASSCGALVRVLDQDEEDLELKAFCLIYFIHQLKTNDENTRRNDLCKVQIHTSWMLNVQVVIKSQQFSVMHKVLLYALAVQQSFANQLVDALA